MTKQRLWSVELREQTRRALHEVPVTPDGLLHMKHADGATGVMDVVELLGNVYRIRRKDRDEEVHYADIEAVLAAGWVID